MNPLPPQAYTKEILLKAYQWLMGQNSSIKEIATTPDALVSLYLKALRDGDESLERPSIQNFKNELRSLAGMMGELEKPGVSAGQVPAQGATSHSFYNGSHQQSTNSPANAPSTQITPIPQTSINLPQSPPDRGLNAMASSKQTSEILIETFDKGTYEMIQEVKHEFNLTSDVETLRMLIKFGYMKSKDLLK
jgi:hypothetical protein